MCLPVSRFRPLPGTYISQSEGQSDTQNRDCFRPLPGTYISQLLHGTSKSGRKFVSVPYRGLIFLNHTSFLNTLYHSGFRPLPGTYISQFL